MFSQPECANHLGQCPYVLLFVFVVLSDVFRLCPMFPMLPGVCVFGG